MKNSLSLDNRILLTEKIHEEKVNNLENKIKIYEDIYKKQLKKEEKMKKNIDNSLISFYNKSNKKLNRKNFIIGELATTRENFRSKFNFHIQSEISLMKILRLGNDINDINEYVEFYNTLKNSEFKTDNFDLSKIHKVISNNKEKSLLNDIAKFGTKNKDLMKKHFEDYTKNKWEYNYTTIQKLKALI